MPHPVSKKRAAMSMADRGAQFSPFAALTGYDGIIGEASRLTQAPVELTQSALEAMNETLTVLLAAQEQPRVRITQFQPDARKSGGSYVTVTGTLKRVEPVERLLILTDGTTIAMDTVTALEPAGSS